MHAPKNDGEPSSARCARCAAVLTEGARFCASCGARVDAGPAGESPSDTRLADTSQAEGAAGGPPGAPWTSRNAVPPMRLAPGTRVSVYRVEDIVGEGGMGVVYRARDTELGRTVALKCLHTNLAGDPQIRRRFAREAKVLRSWVHPNVVAVYDFVEEGHLLAIVMEHVPGESLVKHLARWRGKMPFGEIRAIFGAVLDTMADGHARGIVHRDLKPDNILVWSAPDGPRPKLVDFGISKILEGTSYTVSGAFLGTCRYVSPEQVKTPALVDVRSDVYSLGVTLYQLVTGRVPFEDESPLALIMAHATRIPEPPSLLRADVPKALERLVLDALAKDPGRRPPSCARFRERLDEALAEVAPAPVAQTDRPLPPVVSDTGGHEMVLVPGGPFAMGPARREVHLDAFYIDRAPVTREQFVRFVAVTGYAPTGPGANRFLRVDAGGTGGAGRGHAGRAEDLAKHPVTYVSWADAKAYAQWAGKRLPTEANGRRPRAARTGVATRGGASSRRRATRTSGARTGGRRRSARSPRGRRRTASSTWPATCSSGATTTTTLRSTNRAPRGTRGTPSARAPSSCAAAPGCSAPSRCARMRGRATRLTTGSPPVDSVAPGTPDDRARVA